MPATLPGGDFYVTAHGQAWVDFDVYMPVRWAGDQARRHAAGIPDDLAFATKPQLAMRQLQRQMAAETRCCATTRRYAPSGYTGHYF